MKKKLLYFTIIALIVGLFIIINPAKVFAQNGPSGSFNYITFYNEEVSNRVCFIDTIDNNAQQGATYDKSTNTLTLNNLKNPNLSVEINEMGDDFKIKLVGQNSLRHIMVWGYGFGGSLNITGNGTLDVHSENMDTAIDMYAETAACKFIVDNAATVNLYANQEVFGLYYTTTSTLKNAVQLPGATSVNANTLKLSNGKTITFTTNETKEKIYKSFLGFRPADYTDTFTIFTNSSDSQYIYGAKYYTWISSGEQEYENAWKVWRFIKNSDKYLQVTGEWEQYDIVEDSKLASSVYTNTGNTFETAYFYGVEEITSGKDSSNKQYGIYSYFEWDDELNDSVLVDHVYNMGNSVTVDGKTVYILTPNTTVNADDLTKTVEKELTYYTYILPEKELKIVPVSFPFTDVKTSNWYYNAVKYVYDNNIMSGLNATTFGPNNKLTRGMMVSILYKMEGSPKVTAASNFTDVKDSSKYYYKPAIWASTNKIVSGYNDGRFGPSDNITREQLAVILYKYAKYKGKDVSKTDDLKAFSDANKVASYAKDQVKWAVGSGVITGSNGKLNPKGNATRAEVAAMMEKYCKKVGR